ncbi:MAG: hypothetical protein KC609_14500 [Myxococcales bacterium]|nr:hypothetical protein [Myxococcales bacterium]
MQTKTHNRRLIALVAVFSLLAFAACGSNSKNSEADSSATTDTTTTKDSTGTEDSTTTQDTAGTEDTTTTKDSTGTEDSTSSTDTSSEGDTSQTDVSTTGQVCSETFKTNVGCTGFDDETAHVGPFTITMGGAGFIFIPNCVTLKVGQTVIFKVLGGTFLALHPLRQVCGPVPDVFFTNLDGDEFSVTLTNEHVGLFGLRCGHHGSSDGTGMTALLEVVP